MGSDLWFFSISNTAHPARLQPKALFVNSFSTTHTLIQLSVTDGDIFTENEGMFQEKPQSPSLSHINLECQPKYCRVCNLWLLGRYHHWQTCMGIPCRQVRPSFFRSPVLSLLTPAGSITSNGNFLSRDACESCISYHRRLEIDTYPLSRRKGSD